MMQGLILAGGTSSRAQKNKMTFQIENQALICFTVESMQEMVDEIFLVTGFYHEDTALAVQNYPKVLVVRNRFYERGMFSSVQYGARFLKEDFFLLPGDMPLVKKTTYQTLMAASGDIRIPTFHGEKGHPVWISKNLIADLRNENPKSTLELFIEKHGFVSVEVPDEGILLDVDTAEDFDQILQKRNRKD